MKKKIKYRKLWNFALLSMLIGISLPITLSSCSNQNPQPAPTPTPVLRDLFNIENGVLKGFNPELTPEEIKYKINGNTLKIPLEVTSIADNAFFKDDASTIPDSVINLNFNESLNIKTIGENAFRKSHISKFLINSNLETIGKYAFAESFIEQIDLSCGEYLGETLTIEPYAFYHNDSLKKITLNSKILSNVGDCAFAECHNLEYIDFSTYPNVPSWIGKDIFFNSGSFARCIGIIYNEFNSTLFNKYVLEQGMNSNIYWTFVGKYFNINYDKENDQYILYGFIDNKAPDKIFDDFGENMPIPELVNIIYSNAFYANGHSTIPLKIKNVTLPNNLSTVGAEAFKKAPITSIYLPESLESIGSNCFEESNIYDFSTPSKIECIKSSTFKNCRLLKQVNFGSNVKEIESEAFTYCDSNIKFSFNNTHELWKAIIKAPNWNQGVTADKITCITDEEIPKPIECNLNDVYTSWEKLDWSPKEGDGDITITKIDANLPIVDLPAYKITKKDSKYICQKVTSVGEQAGLNGEFTKITMPNTITIINREAFNNALNLESFTFSKRLKVIQTNAFMNCLKLSEVKLETVNELSISTESFCNCEKLSNVFFPRKINSIGLHAFDDCSQLSSITYEGTVEEWKDFVQKISPNWHKNIKTDKVHCLADGQDCDIDGRD